MQMSRFLMFVTYCFRQIKFALQMKTSALKLPVGHEWRFQNYSTTMKKPEENIKCLAINDTFNDIHQLPSTCQWRPYLIFKLY